MKNATLFLILALISTPSFAAGKKPSKQTEKEPKTSHLRVVAGNLSSGNKQSYDPGHGIRILKSLKPDVVMLQEFNYKDNSEASILEMAKEILSTEKVYLYRESEPSDQIPNGVVSRFPILESGEWTDNVMPNRDYAWAKIDVPGCEDLWAISVHVSAKTSTNRALEARELSGYIEKNIGKDKLIALGGDFNAKSVGEDQFKIYAENFDVENSKAKNRANLTVTNANSKYPYDWVLSSPLLQTLNVAQPLVFDTREYTAEELEKDFKGALTDDSAAGGMQHMAIVRDFEVSSGFHCSR